MSEKQEPNPGAKPEVSESAKQPSTSIEWDTPLSGPRRSGLVSITSEQVGQDPLAPEQEKAHLESKADKRSHLGALSEKDREQISDRLGLPRVFTEHDVRNMSEEKITELLQTLKEIRTSQPVIQPGEDPYVPRQREIHEESVKKTREFVALPSEQRVVQDATNIPLISDTKMDKAVDVTSAHNMRERVLHKLKGDLRDKLTETELSNLEKMDARALMILAREAVSR